MGERKSPTASSSSSSSLLPSLRTQSRLLLCFSAILALQTVLLSSRIPLDPEASTPGGRRSPSAPGAPTGPRAVGAATFTPEAFRAGRPEEYVNLPNVPADPARDGAVRALMGRDVPPPAETLLREAPVPPGSNAILGLASYPAFMDGWRRLVGSLRTNGYDGHIMVGVNPAIPEDERRYLDRMGVTYYAVEVANCTASIMDGTSGTANAVRARCSRGMEDLKLEWGRFEMARRWLRACETCTGWSMVIDTRDIFFQSDPFAPLGNSKGATHDLLFVEEVAAHTNTLPETPHRAVNLGVSGRYRVHVHPCYGKANVRMHELIERPILCSGTVIGTREGMHRFLSVLVDEFRRNNKKGPSCRSPATTDQWTMNHLYYGGRFGFAEETKTLPWGTGPVLTVGKPCVNSALASNKDSQKDMMVFDEGSGLLLNPHEMDESPARVAPTLHQWDRCRGWIKPWFREHEELYLRSERPENEAAMSWVEGS